LLSLKHFLELKFEEVRLLRFAVFVKNWTIEFAILICLAYVTFINWVHVPFINRTLWPNGDSFGTYMHCNLF